MAEYHFNIPLYCEACRKGKPYMVRVRVNLFGVAFEKWFCEKCIRKKGEL